MSAIDQCAEEGGLYDLLVLCMSGPSMLTGTFVCYACVLQLCNHPKLIYEDLRAAKVRFYVGVFLYDSVRDTFRREGGTRSSSINTYPVSLQFSGKRSPVDFDDIKALFPPNFAVG